ncbi:MAG: M43 family zinc metalloprotease [Bacteroidia bacterium]
MQNFLPLAVFCFILLFKVNAQNLECGSTYAVQKALTENPQLLEEIEQLESFTENFEITGERVVRVVPIVFHVIHNYGIENISKEQILDAVRIINEDFNLDNEDQSEVISAFQGLVSDVEFEFRLARLDPNGNCTEGITRTVSELTFNADDNVKELVSWPRNKYLNVWVVDDISFGAGGYAYLPGSAPSAEEDGIVVLHNQLGSTGTSNGSNFASRTLTHEIGHFFNLRHPWGGSNSPGEVDNCDIDDGVTDTPNTLGVANQNCNLSQNTCGSLDNVQNFMDYSSCAIMFTTGQKSRMIAAITSSTAGRNQLWSSANLQATGVDGVLTVCTPIADFQASSSQNCSETDVIFTDLSYNADIDGTWNWTWSFPGGVPSSSTDQNPVVQYTNPGSYPVTLTATNSQGSNSKTKSNYIFISSNTPVQLAPIIEGMETSTFPDNGFPGISWRFESTNNNALSRSTAASTSGTASLIYNNMLVAEGTVSEAYSPVINCLYVGTPARVKFNVAHAQRGPSNTDQLEMWVSVDCGRTWTRRYQKSGSSLATTGGYVSSPWIPNTTQWREEIVSVTPLAGKQTAMIKFTYTDGGGNNIYIDDINIIDGPIGFNEISIDESSISIFPNPSKGDATLSYSLIEGDDISISITDISGRLLGTKAFGKQQPGDYQLELNGIIGSSLNSGIYFVNIDSGKSRLVKKWINN